MQKRVFIVHQWYGNPKSDWYPWLQSMLLEKGFEVIVPKMPNTNEPHISTWVPYLSKAVGKIDSDTYFVGHSVGCQTILRYLESVKGNEKIGGAVFVAGWFHLNELETEEEKEISAEWIKTPIDFDAVKKHMSKSVALFSDNDPYVPISDSKIFEEKLGSKITIHPKRGHFTADDGVLELHFALNEIMKLAKS